MKKIFCDFCGEEIKSVDLEYEDIIKKYNVDYSVFDEFFVTNMAMYSDAVVCKRCTNKKAVKAISLLEEDFLKEHEKAIFKEIINRMRIKITYEKKDFNCCLVCGKQRENLSNFNDLDFVCLSKEAMNKGKICDDCLEVFDKLDNDKFTDSGIINKIHNSYRKRAISLLKSLKNDTHKIPI